MSEPLSNQEIEMVQQSFKTISAISDTAAQLFYTRLFELAPQLRPLFKDDLEAQGKKLMRTLALAVAGLSKMEKLEPMLGHLGRRHLRYGCDAEQYELVGQVLLWTLERGLGDDFDETLRVAWIKTYNAVASIMQEAADQHLLDLERESAAQEQADREAQTLYESQEFQDWLHAAAYGDLVSA